MRNKNFLLVSALTLIVILFGGCTFPRLTTKPESSIDIIFLPPSELPSGKEGEKYPPYSFCVPDSARSGATCGALAGDTLDPIGGNPPYSFSIEFGKGFLPPGMNLELNGLLGGTPSLAGTYTFGVCAKDAFNETCRPVTIVILPRDEEVTPTPTPTAFPTTQPTVIITTKPTPTPTPEVTEVMVPAKVDVTSASCSVTSNEGEWGTVLIKSSGTASGPVDTGLDLPYVWPDDQMNCGSWTTTGNLGTDCVRAEDDPETTNWSTSTKETYVYIPSMSPRSATAFVYGEGQSDKIGGVMCE